MCNLYQIPYAPGCTTMTEANLALRWALPLLSASNLWRSMILSGITFKAPTPWMRWLLVALTLIILLVA